MNYEVLIVRIFEMVDLLQCPVSKFPMINLPSLLINKMLIFLNPVTKTFRLLFNSKQDETIWKTMKSCSVKSARL